MKNNSLINTKIVTATKLERQQLLNSKYCYVKARSCSFQVSLENFRLKV